LIRCEVFCDKVADERENQTISSCIIVETVNGDGHAHFLVDGELKIPLLFLQKYIFLVWRIKKSIT